MKIKSVIFYFYISCSSVATASTPAPSTPNRAGNNVAGPISLLTNYEFWLTICVLVFGCVTLFFSTTVLMKSSRKTSDDIIKIVAVNLIVIGTLVTITAGMSDSQIAPAFGLFGAIAGYLFAKTEDKRSETEKQRKEGDEVQ